MSESNFKFEKRIGINEQVKDDPQTWEYALSEHWKYFSDLAWKGFSDFEKCTREIGHENKVDKFKWREYLIRDMQCRHDEEIRGARDE